MSIISYLGPETSFSHICAETIVSELEVQAGLLKTFSLYDNIQALINKKSQYALMPVENSLGGNVPETIDVIWDICPEYEVKLEYVLDIKHNLLSYSTSLSDIREIRGHPQALAQCQEYIQANLPQAKRVKYPSNSRATESLQELSAEEKLITASIASKKSAQHFDIPVLQESINDRDNNVTRFWLIGVRDNNSIEFETSSQELTSIGFRIPLDQPGGLISVLAPFSESGINLTKIMSTPTKGSLCEYTFIVDYIDNNFDLELIKKYTSEFKLLGKYPVLPFGDNRFN